MRIDEEFLKEVGLGGMPEAEKQAFMQHATEELEARVGKAVGEGLSDAELTEFDEIEDDKAAMDWLAVKVPEYAEITKKVFEEFRQEIQANRQQILGA